MTRNEAWYALQFMAERMQAKIAAYERSGMDFPDRAWWRLQAYRIEQICKVLEPPPRA